MKHSLVWYSLYLTKYEDKLPVYIAPFLPMAHPTLTMAHDGTAQNFALGKQNNTWPEKMQDCI
jgi:hypothetical protein